MQTYNTKSTGGLRAKLLVVRLTRDEMALVRRFARLDKTTESVLIRGLITREARRRARAANENV